MIFLKELAMRRRSLLPLLVILMFLFPLLQAGNSPAKGLDGRQQSMVLDARRQKSPWGSVITCAT